MRPSEGLRPGSSPGRTTNMKMTKIQQQCWDNYAKDCKKDWEDSDREWVEKVIQWYDSLSEKEKDILNATVAE